MDCKRVGEVIFLFFDNEMDEEQLTPFRDHVSSCGDCSKKIDYTRKLLLVVRQRCLRCSAPDRLRHRILFNMPHRNGNGLDQPH